ncbi:MAG TPA: hypothetical protein VGX50_10050, partial [Longimicrobium sp.]|nr:hypothetical protein [Longimicrobium sp.]
MRTLDIFKAAVLAAALPAGLAAQGRPQFVGPSPDEVAQKPARFEVVGRGPVSHTRSTDLWAFRGVD